MASLTKKGMFTMQSSIVNRLGGSTSINSNTSKSQNFPSGGIGARSSAVRRAISAKCQPTSAACNTTTTTTIVDPIISAAIAAIAASTAATTAYVAVWQAFNELESITESPNGSTVLSPMSSAVSNEASAAASASAAAAAGGTTSEVYGLFLATSQYAASVSDSYTTIQASADIISTYSDTITTNAQIAHNNYIIANALQLSI
jgi:hypothetical protein